MQLPGAGLAVVSAEVCVRCAVRDNGGSRRCRTGSGPVGAAAPFIRPQSWHGVHRTDTRAGRDLAVAGVRQVVCFAGWQESVTWRKGKERKQLRNDERVEQRTSNVYFQIRQHSMRRLGVYNVSLLTDLDFY